MFVVFYTLKFAYFVYLRLVPHPTVLWYTYGSMEYVCVCVCVCVCV